MAFLLSSTRALTRAHTMMKGLHPMIAAAPFSSHAVSDHPKNDCHSKHCPNGNACSMVNRFLKEGPSIPNKLMKDEDGMYLRMDMPGIGQNGLKVSVQGSTLYVSGEEEVANDYVRIRNPRKYYRTFQIDLNWYNKETIAAEFKHGVLKIKIPKRKNAFDVHVNFPCKGSKVDSSCQDIKASKVDSPPQDSTADMILKILGYTTFISLVGLGIIGRALE